MKLPLYKAIALIAFLWFATLQNGFASQDMRTWTLTNGEAFSAELIKYDEKTGVVILRIGNKTEKEFQFDGFSPLDRAWLQEWLIIGEELEATLKKLGGEMERLEVKGKFHTEICIYHPTQKEPKVPLPMLILFDPTAKETRYVLRHFEAAEKVKITLVACGSFRNCDSEESKQFEERFAEVLPAIKSHVPHDPAKVFMGGTSGGALRAFYYSVKFPGPWAGIYSNGGWLGGYHKLEYPAMKVAIVNGDKDHANSVVPEDSKVLNARGCDVAVMAFEGGHQFAPISVQIKAFRWLLGLDD